MNTHWWLKVLLILSLTLISIYGIAWLFSLKKYDTQFGVSFSKEYANYLGLDWKKAYIDILRDLKPQYIRIAAPWDEVEEKKDFFDFRDTDFMLNEAQKYNVKALLVVGQKSPRWPECHFPSWVHELNEYDKSKKLLNYVSTTVEKYKNHKALEMWQVENEPYINFPFGECSSYNKDLTKKEIDLIRKADPKRKIVITDSGELSTWYLASKDGDILGTTLYRTVRSPNGAIWKYDWVPPSYYKIRARLWGKKESDFFVSELQAEPWFRDGAIRENTLVDEDKTMTKERLIQNINFTRHVGASRVYLWGVEWWYLMKTKYNDPSFWDVVKSITDNHND